MAAQTSLGRRVTSLGRALLDGPPKKVVLSGPSGFLGSRVLDSILYAHALRKRHGLEPGEVILLSYSPGELMARLSRKYRECGVTTQTIRASRVDYYEQHNVETWKNQLGSLGAHGRNSIFVNLAGIAGPVEGRKDAIVKANYRAPIAAAAACQELEFGHFIQSSSQATNAERAGQVPYSQGKAMADFCLSQITGMPVTIACVGLLYCKEDIAVGQGKRGTQQLNLIDLSVLPLTPIMGSGTAPLQPMEVTDAAIRFAVLALSDPASRPHQVIKSSERLQRLQTSSTTTRANPDLRIYDAVGPECMSILDLLQRFARYQGNDHFRPVFISYFNMEQILNVKSLGNLNRQFVSLLRSEQDGLKQPVIGDSRVWASLLGDTPYAGLTRLDDAFPVPVKRHFPLWRLVRHVVQNPRVVLPGAKLGLEITANSLSQMWLHMRGTRVQERPPAPQVKDRGDERWLAGNGGHEPSDARQPGMTTSM